jgi:hypothetical protein
MSHLAYALRVLTAVRSHGIALCEQFKQRIGTSDDSIIRPHYLNENYPSITRRLRNDGRAQDSYLVRSECSAGA